MKKWKKFLALTLAAITISSLAACNTSTNSGDNPNNDILNEEVDPGRFQLNVSTYDGGYGTAWLGEIKKRYEALHANDVFEGGKKGVQVSVHPVKVPAGNIAASVLDGIDHVYFTEWAYYYELLAKGVLGDITEAVTGDLGGYGDPAGTTIASKLTEHQDQYYNVNGHYYGIPHYAGYGGLTYNKRFFDEQNLYFAKTPSSDGSLAGKFITDANPTKSAGPNGVSGDYDDGLPATYDEFFLLCDFICFRGTPIMLTGATYKAYANYLTKSLAADYEGLDQMMLNYTFDGTATNLATISQSGNIVLDSNDTEITEENGYEVSRQAGKAYALQFIQKLLTYGDNKYMVDTFDDGLTSHTTAQEKFLGSVYDGHPYAMLIDGIWWQSEATQAFSDLAYEAGDEFSKDGSDFAWMPLPKATPEKVGEGITLFDHIYSLCFMKNGLTGEARDLAIDFIKFCNTQESLVEFTQVTGTPKALTYTMSNDEMAGLNSYCKSILNIKNQPTTKIVYPYASSKFYQVNQNPVSNLFVSKVGGSEYSYEAEIFVTTNYSAKDYFDGIYSYRQSKWSSWKGLADAS